MLRRILIPFLCLLGLFCTLQAQDAPALKIATLHPILGDMARAIGGSHVQVADLLRPNGNLHSFEPAPQDIAAAGQARLVLASGKNLEPYLPKLKDALGGRAQILDLGASIPDVPVAADTADHDHGHDGDCCAHGPNDRSKRHQPSSSAVPSPLPQMASQYQRTLGTHGSPLWTVPPHPAKKAARLYCIPDLLGLSHRP